MSSDKTSIKTTWEIATIIRDRLLTTSKDEIIDSFKRVMGDNLYYMGNSMWSLDVKNLIGLNIEFILPAEGTKKFSGKIIKIDNTNASIVDSEGETHNILTEHINNLI